MCERGWPSWSKAVVLRSTRVICVGSNPTPRKKARQRAKVTNVTYSFIQKK